jgi:multiple sugar transport system substrate-binding protein
VKYEAIPWAQYHPTIETRALAGEIVDVMHCNQNPRALFENGLIRAVDDLPSTDELKKEMTPANLDSLKSKEGTKFLDLPAAGRHPPSRLRDLQGQS